MKEDNSNITSEAISKADVQLDERDLDTNTTLIQSATGGGRVLGKKRDPIMDIVIGPNECVSIDFKYLTPMDLQNLSRQYSNNPREYWLALKRLVDSRKNNVTSDQNIDAVSIQSELSVAINETQQEQPEQPKQADSQKVDTQKKQPEVVEQDTPATPVKKAIVVPQSKPMIRYSLIVNELEIEKECVKIIVTDLMVVVITESKAPLLRLAKSSDTNGISATICLHDGKGTEYPVILVNGASFNFNDLAFHVFIRADERSLV